MLFECVCVCVTAAISQFVEQERMFIFMLPPSSSLLWRPFSHQELSIRSFFNVLMVTAAVVVVAKQISSSCRRRRKSSSTPVLLS